MEIVDVHFLAVLDEAIAEFIRAAPGEQYVTDRYTSFQLRIAG